MVLQTGSIKAALLALLAFSSICTAQAGSYKIEWSAITSGGGTASSFSRRINSSVGQSVAGFVTGAHYKHWIGFWVNDINVSPVVVSSIRDAKLLSDGILISISGKVAITSDTDFNGFFYVEESNRLSGIRVEAPGGVAGLMRGHIVDVVGTLGTNSAGERTITGPAVVLVASQTPLAPIGLINKYTGGGDFGDPPAGQYGVFGAVGLNNIGLLIKTWGRVIESGSGYIVIDDGSGTPVRVDTSNRSIVPNVDDVVSVIGISSLAKPSNDRLRLVLPRDSNDMAW